MNLEYVPRIMGNPGQHLATSRREVLDFIRWNSGHAPVFSSHNAYPTTTGHTVPEPRSVLYECTPYDFDFDDLGLPREEAIKLVDDCEKQDIPTRIRFSGSKGFHVYQAWKPITISLEQDAQKRGLKNVIRAVQIHFVRKLGLSTMDGRVIGDYRRLMRIPNTKWAKEKRTASGPEITVGDYYCITLTSDELHTLSSEEVLSLAKSPRKPLFAPVRGTLSILEYLHQEGIDPLAYKGLLGSISGTYAKLRNVPDELVKQYVPKVCIQMDLFSRDPAHLSRFALAAYLNRLSFSKDYIVAFVKSIAEKAGWGDRFNYGVTEYQVDNIVNRNYNPPTCTRLKQEGLCIGPQCPIYFKTEGDDDL